MSWDMGLHQPTSPDNAPSFWAGKADPRSPLIKMGAGQLIPDFIRNREGQGDRRTVWNTDGEREGGERERGERER